MVKASLNTFMKYTDAELRMEKIKLYLIFSLILRVSMLRLCFVVVKNIKITVRLSYIFIVICIQNISETVQRKYVKFTFRLK